MSGIIYYIWRNKVLQKKMMQTNEGENVCIIDCGVMDEERENIFNGAKIMIGDEVQSGVVVLHDKDCLQQAEAGNVILHVGSNAGCSDVEDGAARCVNIKFPDELKKEYERIENRSDRLPCAGIISGLEKIILHNHLSRLLIERIEEKALLIEYLHAGCGKKWEDTLFKTLMRSFGFGIQSGVFEEWARIVDMHALGKHRDNQLQVEAILFGQAGLLEESSIPYYYRDAAMKTPYFRDLTREYRFLKSKFNLQNMAHGLWGNGSATPHVRIARIAAIYCRQMFGISAITACNTIDELRSLLDVPLQGYWSNHTCFGGTETCGNPVIKQRQADVIIINTIVPLLYVYGKHRKDAVLCEKAEMMLYNMKREENSIVRKWQEQGIEVDCAADSQALLQLNKKYCSLNKCIDCHFAFHYIKKRIEEV